MRHKIVGIHGKAGSGKDTAAKILCEHTPSHVVAFADPMKRWAKETFKFSDDQLWGPSESRNKPDPRYPRADGTFLTPREVLQRLGTEVGRACYPAIWTEVGLDTARKLQTETMFESSRWKYTSQNGPEIVQAVDFDSPRVQPVIFTDVRFDTEIAGLTKVGAVLIKIKRPETSLFGAFAQHASEIELPDELFDFVVNNNDTLDHFERLVHNHADVIF